MYVTCEPLPAAAAPPDLRKKGCNDGALAPGAGPKATPPAAAAPSPLPAAPAAAAADGPAAPAAGAAGASVICT